MPEMPVKVTHIITGLGVGGAEMSLLKLLSAMDCAQFDSEVVSLTSDTPLGGRIRTLGIPVTALDLAPSRPDPRLVLRLATHLRLSRPDIVQTWMYHANLVGGLAARLTGSPPVVWNIRHTLTSLAEFKPATRLVVRLCAPLSHSLPARVVCNSEAGRSSHVAFGYDAGKMVVIPNGFNLGVFRPDPQARCEVRRELDIGEKTPLIGLCARFHPDKDHHNFIRAAAILHEQMPEVEFLLWGEAVDARNSTLDAWMEPGSLREKMHLLGRRDDSPRLTAALDLATLSSASDAFPTVVGEAMACEVPCAVTDVGDAALIVGETGREVPRRDPQALAEAWQGLLGLSAQERAVLGKKARQRIVRLFSLEKMAAAYSRLYGDIIAGGEKK